MGDRILALSSPARNWQKALCCLRSLGNAKRELLLFSRSLDNKKPAENKTVGINYFSSPETGGAASGAAFFWTDTRPLIVSSICVMSSEIAASVAKSL